MAPSHDRAHRGARSRLAATSSAAALAIACGAPALERPANEPQPAYPGTCTLIGIEQVSAPIDQPHDTVALIARYRFGDAAEAHASFGLRFEVARARAHDLRQHLATQPTVMCRPNERSGLPPDGIDLKPFDGVTGRPLP